MGTVTKTAAGTYRARWRDPAGRSQSKGFPKRDLAVAHVRTMEGKATEGTYADPKRGRITLRAWIAQCRELDHNLAETSVEIEERACRHLLPVLGDITLENLTGDDIDVYLVSRLREGAAASSVNREYRYIRKWLNKAVLKRRIGINPCVEVTPPQGDGAEMRFLTLEEIVALSKAINPRYRAWVLCGGVLGLRYAEMNGLTPRYCNPLHRKVAVEEQLVFHKGAFIRKKKLKTAASRRTLTIASPFTEIMAEHMGKFSQPDPKGLVFPTSRGTPLIPSSFTTNTFKPAVRKAGLEMLRIHDLRHSAVALAIAEGAHPTSIMKRMGHSSIQVTLGTYGHLFPELDEALADRLGSSLATALAGGQVIPFQLRSAS